MFGKNRTMDNVKEEFPILNEKIIYLDNASTTQKPASVISALVNVYEKANANVHRGMYKLAQESDSLWIEAHHLVAKYLNASDEEVFFVKNATEGINWLALTFENQLLEKGDVIVISQAEHHSNILPWRRLQKKKEIILEVCPLDDDQNMDIKYLTKIFEKHGDKVKLVSVVHTSNVLGNINDIKSISKLCRRYSALLAIDGTQSIAHLKIDVKDLDCDFFIFSGHKVYGPNGVGVVYAKREILEKLEPVFQGGEMVDSVSDEIKYANLPYRFEAGTPNIADGISLAQAIKWFESVENRFEYESELSQYLYKKFGELSFVQVLNKNISTILSFNIKGVHHHDVASDLGEKGICVRAGYHCAQPLHESLNINGSVRVSLCIYNTKSEIDILCDELKNIFEKYNNE
jgi:cysteine desulfurase/selenocysteine lyase